MQASKHDMSTIVHPVNLLVDTEYERAAQLHGAVFASPHEGYGVIAEELQEAVTEIERAQAFMYQLLKAIHEENAKATIDMADCICVMAVNAAAESIQVAAMCEKMRKTMEASKG